MKVRYNINPVLSGYDPEKFFTFGADYTVLADYRQRHSGQHVRDNGFVVIDDRGQSNMLFPEEVQIIEDGEDCYVFEYAQPKKGR